jgi:hypothetical protein
MMSLIRDRSIHTAVERDGLPRVAAYDDGIDRVLFLDGEIVRSVEASAWIDVLPTDPTPAESAAAIAARETERQAKRDKVAQAKAALRASLVPIVGKRAGQWSVAEVRDLLAVVLDALGLLDDDQAVRLPGE